MKRSLVAGLATIGVLMGGVHPPHPRLVTQDRNMVNIPIPQVRSSQLRTLMEMEGFLL